MALPTDPSNVYTIVDPSAIYTIPFGAICYLQLGSIGASKGLLLSLTNAPLYQKVIRTTNGFQGVI